MREHSAGVSVRSRSHARASAAVASAPHSTKLRSSDRVNKAKPRQTATVVTVTGRITERSAAVVPFSSLPSARESSLKRVM